MRTLSNCEAKSVTGAGFNEDIVTVAASIYVGSTIGSFASVISTTAFTGAANALGSVGCLAPLSQAVGTLGTVVSPIMYFAAPLLIFDAVYPGVIGQQVEALIN